MLSAHVRLPYFDTAISKPRTVPGTPDDRQPSTDRKSTRLNSSHANSSYAVFCLKKKKLPGVHSNRRIRSQEDGRCESIDAALHGLQRPVAQTASKQRDRFRGISTCCISQRVVRS